MQKALDREFPNYLRFATCFIVSGVGGKKLMPSSCWRCPFTQACKHHEERRKKTVEVQNEQRKGKP